MLSRVIPHYFSSELYFRAGISCKRVLHFEKTNAFWDGYFEDEDLSIDNNG
jgi:hypothetical protein